MCRRRSRWRAMRTAVSATILRARRPTLLAPPVRRRRKRLRLPVRVSSACRVRRRRLSNRAQRSNRASRLPAPPVKRRPRPTSAPTSVAKVRLLRTKRRPAPRAKGRRSKISAPNSAAAVRARPINHQVRSSGRASSLPAPLVKDRRSKTSAPNSAAAVRLRPISRQARSSDRTSSLPAPAVKGRRSKILVPSSGAVRLRPISHRVRSSGRASRRPELLVKGRRTPALNIAVGPVRPNSSPVRSGRVSLLPAPPVKDRSPTLAPNNAAVIRNSVGAPRLKPHRPSAGSSRAQVGQRRPRASRVPAATSAAGRNRRRRPLVRPCPARRHAASPRRSGSGDRKQRTRKRAALRRPFFICTIATVAAATRSAPDSLTLSPHQHVPELPGILAVDIFREEARPAIERRPVGILADDRAEIGRLHLEAAAEIHLVGLDDAGLGVLQRPYHSGEHRRGHLQAGGVLVGRDPAGLLDR